MSGMLEQLDKGGYCRSRGGRGRGGGSMRCRSWIKRQTARARRRDGRREDAQAKRYRGYVS